MTRRSALILGGLVLVAFGVAGVTFGFAEPLVPADAVPVSEPVAFAGAIAFTVVAALVNSAINARVWRRMGRDLGLTPASRFAIFGKSDLTGEVEGRRVRVSTYSKGGQSESGTTYTFVEAELAAPVDWGALVGPADGDVSEIGPSGLSIGPQEGSLADIPETGDARTVTVQNGLGVWGDLPAEHGERLLTPRVERALAAVDGGVGIGDAMETMVDAMSETLDDADGFGASLAQGMLNVAGDDRTETPSATVTHEQQGLLLDDAALGRRVEAVVATAEAVDQTSNTT